MLPSANLDTFQQQLDSLQKSYSQLGKTPGIPQIGVEKHEILRVPGIADAKLNKVQNDASNAAQSAYLLSVMGKWIANPAATTT